MNGDEERMAMLAGRPLDALDDDEHELVVSWAELLKDPELWAEPPPELEDLVVAGVTGAPAQGGHWSRSSRSNGSWVRPLLAGLAAAAAIVAVVLFVSRNGDGRDTIAVGDLAGTELAPDASGRVEMFADSAGFRIYLWPESLPLLDGGRFYQAWLKGDAGLVPIGTFSQGNGDMVILWSGVDPEAFRTVTVTIEAPDGNQESSGQRVLAGDVDLS